MTKNGSFVVDALTHYIIVYKCKNVKNVCFLCNVLAHMKNNTFRDVLVHYSDTYVLHKHVKMYIIMVCADAYTMKKLGSFMVGFLRMRRCIHKRTM